MINYSNLDLNQFWASPDEALFGQKVIAVATGFSESWFERKRWEGRGIPYLKAGHKCLYRKRDVTEWLSQHHLVTSTSQYNKETDNYT
jgi:hypothetical protein